jgi:hypothetical protein
MLERGRMFNTTCTSLIHAEQDPTETLFDIIVTAYYTAFKSKKAT